MLCWIDAVEYDEQAGENQAEKSPGLRPNRRKSAKDVRQQPALVFRCEDAIRIRLQGMEDLVKPGERDGRKGVAHAIEKEEKIVGPIGQFDRRMPGKKLQKVSGSVAKFLNGHN
jgi:hypothetical protein